MNDSKTLTVILLIAGLVGAAIGSAILFAPVQFSASSNIDLGANPSLLSETRAAGGALLAAGGLILYGAFAKPLRFTATVIAVLIYLSYGGARLVSMGLDGMPHASIVTAAVSEIVIGLLCVFALVRYRTGSRTAEGTHGRPGALEARFVAGP